MYEHGPLFTSHHRGGVPRFSSNHRYLPPRPEHYGRGSTGEGHRQASFSFILSLDPPLILGNDAGPGMGRGPLSCANVGAKMGSIVADMLAGAGDHPDAVTTSLNRVTAQRVDPVARQEYQRQR